MTVTTRLAVDRLRSAQRRRETYVGPWLPEPLVADADGAPDDPERIAIEAERLSLALLGALERLNPVERAVLILRDAFDLDYAEIADVVDRSPANVRQIATRARAHAGDQSRTRPVSAEEQERLATAFMAAALAGDIEAIRAALAADAILYTDGGGVVTAARKPIYGADKIARFLIGVQRKPEFVPDIEYTLVRVNGDFGVRMVSPTTGFLGITAVQVQDCRDRRRPNLLEPGAVWLTVLDGLSVPVVQAPMAGGPSTPELAAAVNRGGGLGFVAAGYLTPDRLREQLQRTAALTDRPFGVNLFVGSGTPGDAAAVAAYGRRLTDVARRAGVTLGEPRFDDDWFAEKTALLVDDSFPGLSVVSFTFGLPPADVGAGAARGRLRAVDDRHVGRRGAGRGRRRRRCADRPGSRGRGTSWRVRR